MSRHQEGFAAGVEVDTDQRIDRLGVRCAMILAHAEQSVARGVDNRVGVAQPLARREGPRRVIADLDVEALVREVGEIDGAGVDGVGPTAILVHARSRVERRRGHVHHVAVGVPPHDYVAAGLARALFHPIDVVPVQADLSEADRPGRNRTRTDGRLPGAVRRSLFLGHGSS